MAAMDEYSLYFIEIKFCLHDLMASGKLFSEVYYQNVIWEITINHPTQN